MPPSKYCPNKKSTSKHMVAEHSPVMHQDLVSFAPQVHFNSSYSGYLHWKRATYQGGCGVSETTIKAQATTPLSWRWHSKLELLVLWFLGCCLVQRTFTYPHQRANRNHNHKPTSRILPITQHSLALILCLITLSPYPANQSHCPRYLCPLPKKYIG